MVIENIINNIEKNPIINDKLKYEIIIKFSELSKKFRKYFGKIKKKNNKNIFLEYRIENLIYPKKIGWITVLIDPNIYYNNIKIDYVDFVFSDIYKALSFFNK